MRRELLSIPFRVFHFLDADGPRAIPPSSAVRAELRAMAAAVALMRADLSSPVATTIVASDAEGGNSMDKGGYGVVAARVHESVARQIFEEGIRPRLTIGREKVATNAWAGNRLPMTPPWPVLTARSLPSERGEGAVLS